MRDYSNEGPTILTTEQVISLLDELLIDIKTSSASDMLRCLIFS